MNKSLIVGLAVAYLCGDSAAAMAADAAAPSSSEPARTPLLFQYLKEGKVSMSLRYRYETYSQATSAGVPITNNAQASTLRFALGYQTKPLYGFSAFGEYSGVQQIGDNRYRVLNVPGQSTLTLPIISDPAGNELNQYYLSYSPSLWKTTFKAGKQEITLNNGRFVSAQPWRQHHETFNAVSVQSVPADRFSFFYAYASTVYRVVSAAATDGILNMTTHMANAGYKEPRRVSATAYGLLLNEYSVPTNATKTFGMRVEGPWGLTDDFDLLYAGEFANQTNYAVNPNHVDVDYYLGEFGVGYKKIELKAQYNVRQARDAKNIFNTPLTGPWDGWVEKFLNNPTLGTSAFGLETTAFSLSGPGRPIDGLTATIIGYDYRSNKGNVHYGRELDAAVEYRVIPWDRNLVVGWRFGRYFADQLFTDSLRTSAYSSFSF